MRSALFALLCAFATQASAQNGVLVSPLPDDVGGAKAIEVARQVLAARGWTLANADRSSIDARKDNSGIRVFASDRALRFSDQSVRPRGTKQREHRDEGPQLTAVPQDEIEALRADLAAAFEGRLPLAGVTPAKISSRVLLGGIPAGADPQRVMQAARSAFVGRRWEVKDDVDGAFIADIHGATESATLKVFLAEGALRYADRSVDRNGARAEVPERWLNNIRYDLRPTISLLAPREKTRPAVRADPAAPSDPAERLRRLKSLLDGGLITQVEYEAKRAEILKGL